MTERENSVLVDESNKEMKRTLTTVYDALKEKELQPDQQIVGYLLSGDPTYATSHSNARSLICKIVRRTHAGAGLVSIWITEFCRITVYLIYEKITVTFGEGGYFCFAKTFPCSAA